MRHSIAHPLILLTVVLVWCPTAAADGPLLTSGVGILREGTGMRGYSFEVGHELTVTGLSKFDGNANGLLDDVVAPRIGLWDSETSELIVSTFIDQTAELRDNMFVKPIEPTVLPPGEYTLAVQTFDDQEPYITHSEFASSLAAISTLTPLLHRGPEFELPQSTRTILSFGPNLLIEQPPIILTQPASSFVVQRHANNMGAISFAGNFDDRLVDAVELRARRVDGSAATPWQPVATTAGRFSGQIDFPAGWFQIEARGVKGQETTGIAATPAVGIGEVLVMAGQSNSANFGSPRLTPADERVLAMDADGNWAAAADPQPVANGSGGSPWPVLGDLLASRLDVPVGIVSVGWGGTSVGQWLPGARGPDSDPLYDRLSNALKILGPEGARAVLWHQGESDAAFRVSQAVYAERLAQVIDQSRADAGFDIPWGVARAAFLPGNRAESNAAILAAQQDVVDSDPLVFAGPLTDDLGAGFRHDGIHFNEAGLRLHAERWVEAVLPLIIPHETMAGDLNGDGVLDLADFLIFRDNFNETGTDRLTGDLNGDTVTDLRDFIVFRVAFGVSAAAATVTVPEPAGFALAAAALFAIVLSTRRQPTTSRRTGTAAFGTPHRLPTIVAKFRQSTAIAPCR